MRTILKYVRPLTGRVAVGMLIKLIRGESVSRPALDVGFTLVVREST